ncbi:MerR family transcriptional regulator [Chitinophagales bacterium]|nr:MerR family transcriptional regulator [Chitinophagales bacterium]
MSRYSIKDLEQLSGIRAHTLRIWEQRHNLLSPKRTTTNIRYYDVDDLKYLLKIAMLNKNGYRISQIASMEEEELSQSYLDLVDSDSRHEFHISMLTTAMIEFDEIKFEEIMETCMAKEGFETTIIDIVYPFLCRIGSLWLSGNINPAQEHFVTNLIRRKLIVAIDGLGCQPPTDAKHFLLFLPDRERHELGLLFSDYLLRKRNHKVTYLGISTPADNVITIVNEQGVDYVFSIFTSGVRTSQYEKVITKLDSQIKEAKIFLTGGQIAKYGLPEGLVRTKALGRVADLFKEGALTGQSS